MRDLREIYQNHMEEEMKGENFPALENKILAASHRKRAAHFSIPKNVFRGAAVCACAAAVVLGSMLFTGSPGVTAPGNTTNDFGLTVYANAAVTDKGPAVPAKNAETIKGFNFDGAENITDFGHQRVIQDFKFDLSCKGSNIKSLKYEISGGGKFVLSEHKSKGGNPYEELPQEEVFSSFTAKPSSDLTRYRIHVEAPITAKEEATLKAEKDGTLYTPEEAARIKARANGGEDVSDILSPCETIMSVNINNVLNGTIVSITATFLDGSTQTARYQLSAVKDYLGAVRAHNKAQDSIEKAYYDVQTKDGFSHSSSGITEKERNRRFDELDKATKYYCITKLN